MNLDELTIGQAKQLAEIFSGSNPCAESSILKDVIGKYCITRSRSEGVLFGKIVRADETGFVIDESRRLFYHKPKDTKLSWYEGVAMSGLHPDSKISGTVERKYVIEDYSLTVCSDEAIKNIKEYESKGS